MKLGIVALDLAHPSARASQPVRPSIQRKSMVQSKCLRMADGMRLWYPAFINGTQPLLHRLRQHHVSSTAALASAATWKLSCFLESRERMNEVVAVVIRRRWRWRPHPWSGARLVGRLQARSLWVMRKACDQDYMMPELRLLKKKKRKWKGRL